MTSRADSQVNHESALEGDAVNISTDMSTLSDPRLFEEDKSPKPAALAFDFSLLALSSINGLGRKGLAALVDTFRGDLGKVWRSKSNRIHEALVAAKTPSADRITSEIAHDQKRLFEQAGAQLYELSSQGIQIIAFKDLPERLRRIPDPPRWLFVQGNAAALYARPAVAVVGTRKPSDMGRRAASYVTRLLSPYPITVVSGLAEGIDEEAHRSALGEGLTNVAFLGHGVNFTFPAATADVRRRIVATGGAVATEYLPNDHYQKAFFVERNRLQAALADVVIPVEANPKGGTAHTVKFAQRYERIVIGIKWKGANGMLEELARAGHDIIDVQSTADSKRLDGVFRKLTRSYRHKPYSLASLEQRVVKEIKSRNVTVEDFRRFVKAVRRSLKEE